MASKIFSRLSGSLANSLKFQCQVCLKQKLKTVRIVLEDCHHSVCRKCLLLQVQISDVFPIRCPFLDRQSSPCPSQIPEVQVKSIATNDVWNHYLFAKNEGTSGRKRHFRCKSCEAEIVVENVVQGMLTCLTCEAVNCLLCHAVHTGMECEEYWEHLETGSDPESDQYPRQEAQNPGNFPGMYPDLNSSFPGSFRESRKPEMEIDDEEVTLLVNRLPFECPICYSDIGKGEGVLLHGCLHTFCRSCIANTIQYSVEPEVGCPHISDTSCLSKLQDREIREISTPEVYELFCKRSISAATETGSGSEQAFHCRKADCPGLCFVPRSQAPEVYECPVCFNENCIACAAIHSPLTCKQFRERQERNRNRSKNRQAEETKIYLDDLLKRGLAMRCSKCSAVVEKDDGCDSITCAICRTELCWATKGPRWGPGGKGDLSAGCRCKVGGVLCTPECRNCH